MSNRPLTTLEKIALVNVGLDKLAGKNSASLKHVALAASAAASQKPKTVTPDAPARVNKGQEAALKFMARMEASTVPVATSTPVAPAKRVIRAAAVNERAPMTPEQAIAILRQHEANKLKPASLSVRSTFRASAVPMTTLHASSSASRFDAG